MTLICYREDIEIKSDLFYILDWPHSSSEEVWSRMGSRNNWKLGWFDDKIKVMPFYIIEQFN